MIGSIWNKIQSSLLCFWISSSCKNFELHHEGQGRINGFPRRVRVGWGNDREGHWGIWQEQWARNAQKRQKSKKSSRDRTWSAVPDALLGVISWISGLWAGHRTLVNFHASWEGKFEAFGAIFYDIQRVFNIFFQFLVNFSMLFTGNFTFFLSIFASIITAP